MKTHLRYVTRNRYGWLRDNRSRGRQTRNAYVFFATRDSRDVCTSTSTRSRILVHRLTVIFDRRGIRSKTVVAVCRISNHIDRPLEFRRTSLMVCRLLPPSDVRTRNCFVPNTLDRTHTGFCHETNVACSDRRNAPSSAIN